MNLAIIDDYATDVKKAEDVLFHLRQRLEEAKDQYVLETTGIGPGVVVKRNGHTYKVGRLIHLEPVGGHDFAKWVRVHGHKKTKSGWHKAERYICLGTQGLEKVEA